MSVTGMSEEAYNDIGEDPVRYSAPETPKPSNNFWSDDASPVQAFANVTKQIDSLAADETKRAADEIERRRRWEDYCNDCMIMMRNW